jgi:hypothetical protein
MSVITATVADTTPSQASASPPTPVVTATAMPRGAVFTWSSDTWIQPYEWEYQTQVAAEGWSATIQTLFPVVIRTLTAAELTSAGATASVQIRVRSTDGVTPTAWVTGTVSALVVGAVAADIPTGTITLTMLAAATLATMFSSTDRDGADLKATSVALAKLASDATDRMFTATGRVATDTVSVNSVAAATVSGGAAQGALAYAKVPANVLSGAETILTDVTGATAITNRLSATEKTNLESALGVALASIDVTGGAGNIDRLLIANGVNKNIVGNATSIKTDLSLNLVQNYTAANQVIQGLLDAAAIIAFGTTADTWIAAGWQAFIDNAARNDTIDKDTIETVKASHVQIDGAATGLFDTSWNLTFGAAAGVGIKSGADVRTPADIIYSMDVDGNSIHCDFATPKTGQTLDNIPDGSTYKLITSAKSTSLGYLVGNINSSGRITSGTTNFTVAQIEENVDDYYGDFSGHNQSASTTVITGLSVIDVDPSTGVAQLVFETPVLMRKGTASFKIRVAAYTDDPTNTLTAQVYSELDAVLGTPAASTADTIIGVSPTYAAQTLTVAVTTSTTAGNIYMLRLLQTGATASDIKIKVLKVWQVKA